MKLSALTVPLLNADRDALLDAAGTAAQALRAASSVEVVWRIAVSPGSPPWQRAAIVTSLVTVPQILGGPLAFAARYFLLYALFRSEAQAQAGLALALQMPEGKGAEQGAVRLEVT